MGKFHVPAHEGLFEEALACFALLRGIDCDGLIVEEGGYADFFDDLAFGDYLFAGGDGDAIEDFGM
jgi:hypothetical protein